MTFSIAARCDRTGMFGLAVCSSSPAVAARCAHIRAGVGAIASQNVTDPRLGSAGLNLMAQGHSAEETIATLRLRAGDTAPYRQITAIDATGATAAFSGASALGTYGHHAAHSAVAAGNMLRSEGIPEAMVSAYLAEPDLMIAARLLRALDEAMAMGGEEGLVHSCGLLVTDIERWPLVDLRVDWDDQPVTTLQRLWTLWEPQMHDYVTRALNPDGAPSYGVPGDP